MTDGTKKTFKKSFKESVKEGIKNINKIGRLKRPDIGKYLPKFKENAKTLPNKKNAKKN